MVFSVSSLPSTYHLIPKTTRLSNSRHLHTLTTRPRCSTSMTNLASTSFDLHTYWTSVMSIIESNLDDAFVMRKPEKLIEVMRYSIFHGGAKRSPPVLCIAACELFGTPRAAALPTAAALEIIHAATLVHDDLSMDTALLRGGRPSTQAKYGAGAAVPVGDALFSHAFDHVFTRTPSDLVSHEVLLSVLKEIARAVGCNGMGAGQLLDLTGVANRGEAEVMFVLEKKFGELTECSAVCGGMLGGAKEDDQLALRRYGRTVGMLYELVDDVFKESNYEQVGRMQRNASVVMTIGMARALELVEQLSDKAKNELPRFGDRYGDRVLPLYHLVDYAVERCFLAEGREEAVRPAASC